MRALLEDGVPAQARLRAFQDEELKPRAVIMHRHTPLGVVIRNRAFIMRPRATRLHVPLWEQNYFPVPSAKRGNGRARCPQRAGRFFRSPPSSRSSRDITSAQITSVFPGIA